MVPKTPQDAPKTHLRSFQDALSSIQDAPKTVPRRLQDAPRRPPEYKTTLRETNEDKAGTKWNQVGAKSKHVDFQWFYELVWASARGPKANMLLFQWFYKFFFR